MDAFTVYKDIQARTKGQFLVGVVGPVRTGKSTFIRRFMEVLALPEMEEEKKAEIQDQLPLSGSGKLITTVEPKFIPKEAVELCLGGEVPVKLRLIDCVGFLVPDALGNLEADKERMVKTPWFDEAIPFHRAAEVGTQRVISQHSTIGLVVTCDGSFGEIPRENFVESEERTVAELKKQGKPFLILVNSQKPYREETQKLAAQLQEKYEAAVMSVNCEQLRREDITKILEKILYEFPIRQLEFYIPKWLELLPCDHEIKKEILGQIRDRMGNLRYIRDITPKSVEIEAPCVKRTVLEQIDLATGQVKIQMCIRDRMELICSEYESDQSFALTEFQYEGRKFLLGSLVVPPDAEECKENISFVFQEEVYQDPVEFQERACIDGVRILELIEPVQILRAGIIGKMCIRDRSQTVR